MQITDIPLEKIYFDPTFNCRGPVAPIDVVDLARDIEHHGLQQPIVVQPYDERFRIIMGHRRFIAYKVLKRETIPCRINTDLTESAALILNLGENIHRKDLNIIQEATALERLKLAGMGINDVANELGKSTTWVNIRYMLLELPKAIKDAAAAGFITQKQIMDLYKIKDPMKQLEAAADIKKAKMRGERPPVIKKGVKRNIFKNKQRDTDDIFWMQEHIQESVGNNFGTRCLAWAAGEISDFELFKDVQYIAEKEGKIYKIPYVTVS